MFMQGPLPESKTLVIPHGQSVREIASALGSNNVVSSSLLFRLGAKTLGSGSLKAGEYEFTPHQSIADILSMMQEGRSVVHWFKVPEGLTSFEITSLMRNTPALAGEVAVPPEGSLLPETYRFSYGDMRAGIIARMQKAMQDLLVSLWTQRDVTIPIQTPAEALVMASIIEKETGKPEERPRIAGVFYNRLRSHMRLQSDPTVIYGITRGKTAMGHELEHDDLAVVSPYNTYLIDGLPPQPICSPGRASIEAALHPEQNEYLYFVADGTGGHTFSKSLGEHNQNVAKWNKVKAKP